MLELCDTRVADCGFLARALAANKSLTALRVLDSAPRKYCTSILRMFGTSQINTIRSLYFRSHLTVDDSLISSAISRSLLTSFKIAHATMSLLSISAAIKATPTLTSVSFLSVDFTVEDISWEEVEENPEKVHRVLAEAAEPFRSLSEVIFWVLNLFLRLLLTSMAVFLESKPTTRKRWRVCQSDSQRQHFSRVCEVSCGVSILGGLLMFLLFVHHQPTTIICFLDCHLLLVEFSIRELLSR
jgi:hypothetical protein